MDAIDRLIVNHLQRGFPVVAEPYAAVAAELGIGEAELLQRLDALLEQRILSRFGPMFNAERMGGGLTLAAMAVPDREIDAIAGLINALPQVAHNYARDHRFNLWFVVATETAEEIDDVLNHIAQTSGYKVYNMPKQEEFYVGLYLSV